MEDSRSRTSHLAEEPGATALLLLLLWCCFPLRWVRCSAGRASLLWRRTWGRCAWAPTAAATAAAASGHVDGLMGYLRVSCCGRKSVWTLVRWR